MIWPRCSNSVTIRMHDDGCVSLVAVSTVRKLQLRGRTSTDSYIVTVMWLRLDSVVKEGGQLLCPGKQLLAASLLSPRHDS